MLNKQSMKLTIIHIGLAVISVGMMFIILGINDGGGEGGVKLSGIDFNFKTVSSGLAIFIAGALMASGALINNIYTTAAVPGYVQILSPESKSDDKTNNPVKFYKKLQAITKMINFSVAWSVWFNKFIKRNYNEHQLQNITLSIYLYCYSTNNSC